MKDVSILCMRQRSTNCFNKYLFLQCLHQQKQPIQRHRWRKQQLRRQVIGTCILESMEKSNLCMINTIRICSEPLLIGPMNELPKECELCCFKPGEPQCTDGTCSGWTCPTTSKGNNANNIGMVADSPLTTFVSYYWSIHYNIFE